MEDYVVGAGDELRLVGPGSAEYDTLTLVDGGQIICEGTGTFTLKVNKLIKCKKEDVEQTNMKEK